MSSAQLVAEARKRAELSRRALAERLGVSTSTIGRWERRRSQPSYESLLQVMEACDLDLLVSIVPRDHEGRRLLAAQSKLSPDEVVDQLVAWASDPASAIGDRAFFPAPPPAADDPGRQSSTE